MNINAAGNAGIYSMQQAYRNQAAARSAMVHQEHGFCPHCQNLAMQAEKEMNVQPLGSGAAQGGQAQDVWIPGVRDPQAMQQQLRDVPLPGQGRAEPQAEEAEVQPMPVFGSRANPDAADAVEAQPLQGTQFGGEGLQQSPEEARQEQQVQQAVAELQQREREVIAHEQAHMTAGGHLTGGASYQFTTGPDGNQYITGGEVSISMPEGNTPQETISNMDQVIRAALAPANPSPQDMAVASRAAMRQMQARVEQVREQAPEAQEAGRETPEVQQGEQVQDVQGSQEVRATQENREAPEVRESQGIRTAQMTQTPQPFQSFQVNQQATQAYQNGINLINSNEPFNQFDMYL